jgi:hypothetical protein
VPPSHASVLPKPIAGGAGPVAANVPRRGPKVPASGLITMREDLARLEGPGR